MAIILPHIIIYDVVQKNKESQKREMGQWINNEVNIFACCLLLIIDIRNNVIPTSYDTHVNNSIYELKVNLYNVPLHINTKIIASGFDFD